MGKNKVVISIVFGIIAMFLVVIMSIQFKTINQTDITSLESMQEEELRNQIVELKEKNDEIQNKISENEEKIKEYKETLNNNQKASEVLNNELHEYEETIGLTDVTGEGVIVTAADGQVSKVTDNDAEFLVHDGDLREIVSELSNAGAEAISINDQRIVNSTCITCAGNVISINGEKVSSPFVIKAIGNQESLFGINRPGGYLSLMKDYTKVDLKKASNITIKKFDGAIKFNYANFNK